MALLNITTNQDGVHVVSGIYPDDSEVASYIVKAAKARGIDPNTALTVWSHEGRGAWQSNYTNKHGQREKSYGPFQLYKGGGLGNQMQEETGLDPADPKNWKQSVDWALDYAAKNGWTSKHGTWYGAKRAGITGKMGIGGNPTTAVNPPTTGTVTARTVTTAPQSSGGGGTVTNPGSVGHPVSAGGGSMTQPGANFADLVSAFTQQQQQQGDRLGANFATNKVQGFTPEQYSLIQRLMTNQGM